MEEVSGFPAENGTIALVCRENKQNYNFIISCWDNRVVICRTLITQKVKIIGLSFIVHPSDFKSNESFFKKDSPDQKSGFRYAERNAKSFLRCKIRFWIHRKEQTLRFELLSRTTVYSDKWLNLALICQLSTNAPFTRIKHDCLKTDTDNWNTGFFHRVQMKFNMFCNLH